MSIHPEEWSRLASGGSTGPSVVSGSNFQFPFSCPSVISSTERGLFPGSFVIEPFFFLGSLGHTPGVLGSSAGLSGVVVLYGVQALGVFDGALRGTLALYMVRYWCMFGGAGYGI